MKRAGVLKRCRREWLNFKWLSGCAGQAQLCCVTGSTSHWPVYGKYGVSSLLRCCMALVGLVFVVIALASAGPALAEGLAEGQPENAADEANTAAINAISTVAKGQPERPADEQEDPAAVLVCRVLDPELQVAYSGGCRDGLAHGQGVARGKDGAYYQGRFVAGQASGYGVKLYANGDAYAGQWKNGQREGEGVYEYGEQSPWRGDKYVGSWQNDQQHGRGTYFFYPGLEGLTGDWHEGATKALATPLLARRKRAYEAVAPELGQPGTVVCSVLTDGASPERVAYGVVEAVQNERIQVRVNTPAVLKNSRLRYNPRWDLITEWTRCEP